MFLLFVTVPIYCNNFSFIIEFSASEWSYFRYLGRIGITYLCKTFLKNIYSSLLNMSVSFLKMFYSLQSANI